jgi:hypothetical protein
MSLSPRPVALAAGLLMSASAAIDIPYAQHDVFSTATDYVLEGFFALGLVTGATTLWMLCRAAPRRGARLAWAVAATGTSLVGLAATGTVLAGRNVLGPAFGLGLLAILVGYAVLAVLDLRRRVSPRFAGLALAASVVAMAALGDGPGMIGWAAGWFALAALLQPVGARATEPVPAA